MIEILWLEKIKILPDEVLERLEWPTSCVERARQYFLSGYGWEFFLEKMLNRLNPTSDKVFILPEPALSITNVPPGCIILQGDLEQKLKAFQEDTFELVILLWNISVVNPKETLAIAKRALKKNGQIVLVTNFDGSPEVPLTILRKALRQITHRYYKLCSSTLPENSKQLRKLLESNGFKDVRVWVDTLQCNYPDGQAMYEDLVKFSPGGLFQESVSQADRILIKEKFIEIVQKKFSSKSILVDYTFGGAIGIK